MKRRIFYGLLKLRQLLGVENVAFPLKPANGYLPAFHNNEGNLRCPSCGHTDFGVKDHTTITCKSCMQTFNYYGRLGLKPQTELVS